MAFASGGRAFAALLRTCDGTCSTFTDLATAASCHFRLTGTLGGVPVERTMWQASLLRDGKVTWFAFYRGEPEAFEAAGLSE
jgi:hypothetical protein